MVLNSKVASQLQMVRHHALSHPKSHEGLDYYDLDSDIENLPQVNVSRPFKQANDEQNQFMKAWLSHKLEILDKNQSVLELFCGSGNFTEVISSFKFENIFAVEGNKEALINLQKKKLSHVKLEVANLFSDKAVRRLVQKAQNFEILFLDPPRDGFDKIEEFILKMKNIKTVIYISCNLHTFVRDSKSLIKNGFQLVDLQPVDQFPHTPHIELLAHFIKI
jgi:23S rRNA (uracil1939-C5)-methyltransferase